MSSAKSIADSFGPRQWFEADYDAQGLRFELMWRGETEPFRCPYGPSIGGSKSAKEVAERIGKGLSYFSYDGPNCVRLVHHSAEKGFAVYIVEGGCIGPKGMGIRCFSEKLKADYWSNQK